MIQTLVKAIVCFQSSVKIITSLLAAQMNLILHSLVQPEQSVLGLSVTLLHKHFDTQEVTSFGLFLQNCEETFQVFFKHFILQCKQNSSRSNTCNKNDQLQKSDSNSRQICSHFCYHFLWIFILAEPFISLCMFYYYYYY